MTPSRFIVGSSGSRPVFETGTGRFDSCPLRPLINMYYIKREDMKKVDELAISTFPIEEMMLLAGQRPEFKGKSFIKLETFS